MKTPLAYLWSAVGASLFLFAGCAANAWEVAAPGGDGVTLRDFKLVGDLNKERAAFTLSAMVKVENPKGGTLDLISGPVALTELGAHPKWKIRAEQNRYVLTFDRSDVFYLHGNLSGTVRVENVLEERRRGSVVED